MLTKRFRNVFLFSNLALEKIMASTGMCFDSLGSEDDRKKKKAFLTSQECSVLN